MGIWSKKSSLILGKNVYFYPRSPSQCGSYCISPCYEKLIRKAIHFLCDEVFQRMRTGWEKSTHTMGKGRVPISQNLPTGCVLLHFLVLRETDAMPIYLMRFANFSLCFRLCMYKLGSCWQMKRKRDESMTILFGY